MVEYFNLKKDYYKVLVRCVTYNHVNYIIDALNGFVIQETNFPYICLVIDDASTDGEQDVLIEFINTQCQKEICVKYEDENVLTIKTIHRTNVNCHFVFYLLKKNLYKEPTKRIKYYQPWRENCSYESLCEGDDLWIESNKLQMQVDFLDNNQDYGLCYTQCSVCKEQNIQEKDRKEGGPYELFKDLILKNSIPTPTVMFRTNLILEYYKEGLSVGKGWQMSDYPMWLWFSIKSKIKHIDSITSIYRVVNNSASNRSSLKGRLNFIENSLAIQEFFCHYKNAEDLLESIRDRAYYNLMTECMYFKNPSLAINYYNKIKNPGKYAKIKLFLCKNNKLFKLYTLINNR